MAVNEITARQTRTSLRKYYVITVCSVEYLTTQIEAVPTFKSRAVHITEYLTLGLLSSLRNVYKSTTAYFFDPPCISTERVICKARTSRAMFSVNEAKLTQQKSCSSSSSSSSS